MKRLNLTPEELAIRHIGGAGQTEVYQALQQGVGHATMVTPPLDARAKRDGFNVVYHLDDLKLPAIYSSLFTNDRLIKERPAIAQKFVAALAEAVHFVEHNPDKAKQSVSRVLALHDLESAQSAYDAYAKRLINRRLTIPGARVNAAIDAARQAGANVRRKSAETFDNSFAEHLEKSGFIKDLWGAELPAKKW
jgi:ABC-type nitrate/sulfonate/bicarbonate transport system substrate-binding protein